VNEADKFNFDGCTRDFLIAMNSNQFKMLTDLKAELTTMTQERDELKKQVTVLEYQKEKWLEYSDDEWKTVQHTAARCAEIVKSNSLMRGSLCEALSAIRKEFSVEKATGLSKETIELLLGVLDSSEDEGPHGEGWKSDKLIKAIAAFRKEFGLEEP